VRLVKRKHAFLEMSSGETTVSERAELSTSVKPMDDFPKSKSGESQTKLNKTYLPTSGDDGHVARWVADLEQHLLRMWSQFLHQRSTAILIQYALARRDRVLPAKNIAVVSSRPDWPLRSLTP